MHKLADQNFKDNITTELNKTEKQILNYIKDMQPVCQRLVKMNSGSKSESTIRKNIKNLRDKDMIKIEDGHGNNKTLSLTSRGMNHV